MLATGGLLLSIALLTLAVLVPVFHSSDPPRWATRGWIGEVVTVALVSTLALGLVYLVAGAIDASKTGPDYLDLGLLAVVLVASIVIWRRLKARTRQKAAEPAASVDAFVPEPAQSGGAAESLRATASEPPPPHKAA
jgi:hypothetical protein